MMQKIITLITIFFISNSLYSQKASLGLQYTFPSYGISGKLHLNDHNSVQAVFGAFGIVSNFSGRYNYLFDERGKRNVKPFLYGQVGMWRYNSDILSIDESALGFGFGAGLEFDWMDFISENLSTSIEIGYGNVDLLYYDFAVTSFGFGLHYNFGF